MSEDHQKQNITNIQYLVIYNEQSGMGYYNHKKVIQKIFEKENIACTIHNTTPDGSFLDIDPNNFKKIIVAGGDGTLKEVANWILKAESSTPLAIIPRGSANVFADALGIPINTIKALEIAINGNVKKIDVGLMNKKEYFLISTGMGFDAKIMKHTSKKLKRIFGVYAYAEGLIKSFLNYHVDKFFIKSEDFEGTVKAQMILVANIPEYKGVSLNPKSSFNDELLNVTILGPASAIAIVKIFFKLLQGEYTKDWRYTSFTTKKIYILPLTKHTPMQIDGDLVFPQYMDIEIIPNALSVVTKQ